MKENVLEYVKSFQCRLKNNRKLLYKLILILIILSLAFIMRLREINKSNVTVEVNETDLKAHEICVDIGGAVMSPGVYKVEDGTRLYEVIELAGGLSEEADTSSVNQASYVEDGQKIIIPSASETETTDTDENSAATEESAISDNVTDTDTSLVNINTASKEELMTLSGIGDVIADRIIEYRTKTPFKDKEDIMAVKGIGTSVFEKISSSITT